MLDKWLFKSKLDKALEKFVERFILGKISANQMTILGLIFGICGASFIFFSGIFPWIFELTLIAVILIIISFFLDTLDGRIARLEKPTDFGGILDIFCDRVVEVAIIISIISTDTIGLLWPGIFSLSAIILCLTMFLMVGGVAKSSDLNEHQKVIYYRHGLMERSETFLFLLIIAIVTWWRFWLLLIFALLVFLTALLRLRDAYIIFYKIKKHID